jgi:hypothetical protein
MQLDDNADIVGYLPAGSSLYIRQGVPNLFHRAGNDSPIPGQDAWLVMPESLLSQTVTENGDGDASEGARIPGTMDLDGRQAFPIVRNGGVIALLIYAQDALIALSSGQLIEIGSQLAVESDRSIVDERENSRRFVRMLFQRDHSAETFFKCVVNLMTEFWGQSYGAIYSFHDGVFSIRAASGSLDYCHHLPSHINHILAGRLETCLQAGTEFITADPISDRPAFLPSAPDIFFVSPGIELGGVRHILVVAGGGDIPFAASASLQQAADLLNSVDEYQFATSRSIIKLYESVVTEPINTFSVDELLLQVFEALVPQIDLARMVVTVMANNKASGISQVISPATVAAKRVELVSDITHPENILQSVLNCREFHIPNIAESALSERQTRQRYLASVKSELYLPIKSNGETRALVAFGSSRTGDYLTQISHVLQAAANLMGLTLALADSHLTSAGATESPDHSSETEDITAVTGRRLGRSTGRLVTVRRLARGYLHDMLSLLSVVIGSAEVTAQSAGAQSGLPTAANRMKMGLARIDAAADRLSAHVSTISRLLSMADTTAGVEVSLRSFVSELPQLLYGLIKQNRDTKDLDFQIKVPKSNGGEISVQTTDLYDHVLALLVEVMDKATVSGQIEVALKSSNDEHRLAITCEKQLFGANNPGRLVESVFYRSSIDWTSPHSGSFNTGPFRVEFGRVDHDAFRITMIWPEHKASARVSRSKSTYQKAAL